MTAEQVERLEVAPLNTKGVEDYRIQLRRKLGVVLSKNDIDDVSECIHALFRAAYSVATGNTCDSKTSIHARSIIEASNKADQIYYNILRVLGYPENRIPAGLQDLEIAANVPGRQSEAIHRRMKAYLNLDSL